MGLSKLFFKKENHGNDLALYQRLLFISIITTHPLGPRANFFPVFLKIPDGRAQNIASFYSRLSSAAPLNAPTV